MNIVNIGLNINGVRKLTPRQALFPFKKLGISIPKFSVHQSKTEPTLVANMSRALTAKEGNQISLDLKQEAIAQFANGRGHLYGPKAKQWQPFNRKLFLTKV